MANDPGRALSGAPEISYKCFRHSLNHGYLRLIIRNTSLLEHIVHVSVHLRRLRRADLETLQSACLSSQVEVQRNTLGHA